MTQSREGWYADPHAPQYLRWWDGTAWTDRTQPRPGGTLLPTASFRPPLNRHWGKLAVALQISLALSAIVSVFIILTNRTILDVWRRLAVDPTSVSLAEAERADSLALLAIIETPVYLAAGVLFIVWLFQAHHSDRMNPGVQTRGSGWTIGSWFTPIVNLWFPYQAVSDLRRSADGRGSQPSMVIQGLWWAAFLAMNIASGIVLSLYGTADDTADDDFALYAERLEAAIDAELVEQCLTIVAAVLAIAMVRQFTAWVRSSNPAA